MALTFGQGDAASRGAEQRANRVLRVVGPGNAQASNKPDLDATAAKVAAIVRQRFDSHEIATMPRGEVAKRVA